MASTWKKARLNDARVRLVSVRPHTSRPDSVFVTSEHIFSKISVTPLVVLYLILQPPSESLCSCLFRRLELVFVCGRGDVNTFHRLHASLCPPLPAHHFSVRSYGLGMRIIQRIRFIVTE